MNSIYDGGCPWAIRPCTLKKKLLNYLPVITIDLNQSVSGVGAVTLVSARPPDGSQFLQQLCVMASKANKAAAKTQEIIQGLPISDYLLVMDTEKDRRVFKGLVAAVTNPTFVRQNFNWSRSSIAQISEDLDVVGCFVADYHEMMHSIEYCNTASVQKRRQMRKQANLQLKLNDFLSSHGHGGRPSLILEYS